MGYKKDSGFGRVAMSGTPFTGSGKIFCVGDNTTSNRSMLFELWNVDPDGAARFFSTIDAANNACTASAGDVIYVMPGHAETLTTAGAIALDVAGVTVRGLGAGNNRPVITLGSTDNTASITMSGANCRLENIVLVCNDDGLTNGLNVTGDNCYIDIETQDTSSLIEFATAVRLDTANNSVLKLKHIGFTAGNAMVSCVRLDDCDNVRIDIDGYGVVSTAWVEMVDVASTNVYVTGRAYTQAITNGSRDIVDTITSSTWYGRMEDMSAAAIYSGGSGSAWATDDITVVATAVGAVADAALADTIEGAAASTQSIVTDLKGVLQRLGADNANNTAATTLVAANVDGSILERLEAIQQHVGATDGTTNILGANDADNGFDSSAVVANVNGSIVERLEDIVVKVTAVDDILDTEFPVVATAVGAVADAALADTIEGAAATVQSLLTDVKGVLQRLGADNADNTAATTLVADNRDGSILERLEAIISTLRDDVASNFIGVNDGDNAAITGDVVANADGSILERLEDLLVKLTAVDDIIDTEFPIVVTAVGAVADAAIADTIEGAAATTQSLLTDLKGVLQRLGADNANNTAATTLVAANDDGSIFERLEGLKQGTILARGTFTTDSATVPADTGRAEANDYWNGCLLVPVAGAIAFEPRLIVDFANAGGVFTLDTDIPFTAVPGLVAYAIIPGNIQLAPTADSTANATPAHVIGRKTDAAATGAVSTTESLMAYAKQLVTEGIARDAAITVIDDFLDTEIGTADGATTESINGKLGTDTELADRSLYDQLNGAGPAAAATATPPGNNVSLYSAVRYISENQLLSLVSKTYANLAGYDTAAAFTVSGDVLVRVFGTVGAAAITSTSGTTTLSVGTTADPDACLPATTIDNSDFAIGDAWTDNNPEDDASIIATTDWVLIAGGADIILTRNVDDLTAGSLTLYCEYKTLSPGASVVAA